MFGFIEVLRTFKAFDFSIYVAVNFDDTNDTDEILAQLLKYCQGHACFLWDARIWRGKLHSHKNNLM